HLPQKGYMRCYGIAHFGIFNIADAIFLAGLAYDFADSGIVYVRNFGKQVMLYLEIEPAYQPADKPVVGGKVGRGLELVYGPFIFHFPGKFIGHGEMRMLYRMGQLENDAQYKAGYQAYGQESDKPGNGANEKDRQHYKKK